MHGATLVPAPATVSVMSLGRSTRGEPARASTMGGRHMSRWLAQSRRWQAAVQ